jgi:hypothetical protein
MALYDMDAGLGEAMALSAARSSVADLRKEFEQLRLAFNALLCAAPEGQRAAVDRALAEDRTAKKLVRMRRLRAEAADRAAVVASFPKRRLLSV